ncbi:recombinase family protein, partial [Chloroflexota bacterium]
MTQAAIYCRVSTEDQEREGTSLQTQLEACLSYCHNKGYEVACKFSEAYSGLELDRPELNELRELARAGKVDVIVVYCLDRLSRDPTHGVILTQELEKHGVNLEAVTENVDSSELGKLITYIRGFASKLEAEKIRERTMRGKRASALEGKIPHGGFARLYGYDYDRTLKKRIVNETEAYWVKQAYGWLVNEQLSTNAVTYRLRELNAPTKEGKPWQRSSVMAILKNLAYTGKTYAFTVGKPQSEWIEIPDVTPPIITEEMFEAAQTQLRLNRKDAERNVKQQYFLRGHLYCRHCGKAYCGHIDRTIRYYRCPGKLRITSPVSRCCNDNWRADKIEALVWEQIERVLDNPELIIYEIQKQSVDADRSGVLETELKHINRQLKVLDHEQEQLLQWALKGFPEETVIAENKKINGKRDALKLRKRELESQLEACLEAANNLPKLHHLVELIREQLKNLDFDTRRRVLDSLGIKVWLDGQHVEVT